MSANLASIASSRSKISSPLQDLAKKRSALCRRRHSAVYPDFGVIPTMRPMSALQAHIDQVTSA
jgi:hypothetical protein